MKGWLFAQLINNSYRLFDRLQYIFIGMLTSQSAMGPEVLALSLDWIESSRRGNKMSNRIVIGIGQMGPSSFKGGKPDKEENVRRILKLAEKGLQREVKIICFPELALTDYFPARMDPQFEDYFDQIPNEVTKDIFLFTQEHPISIILPYAEFDGVAFYNSAALIHQGKLIGKYRKVHIPGAIIDQEVGLIVSSENQYFAPGNLGFPVFDIWRVKIGVQICYDRSFPEGYRALALKGAQIVFNPTNTSYRGLAWRKTSWETFLVVRSFENNLFVVGVNKAGVENGIEFAGDSMAFNPVGGTVMARTQTKEDELVAVEVNLDDILKAKKLLPAFRDRVPAAYEILVM